jgi:hypothetical protein
VHLCPSSVEVKNGWSFTSTVPNDFMVCTPATLLTVHDEAGVPKFWVPGN